MDQDMPGAAAPGELPGEFVTELKKLVKPLVLLATVS